MKHTSDFVCNKNGENYIPRELTVSSDLLGFVLALVLSFPYLVCIDEHEQKAASMKSHHIKRLIKHVQCPLWRITGTGFEQKPVENCVLCDPVI